MAWPGTANRMPVRDRPGAPGWRRGPLYRRSRVMPVEGRGLSSRQTQDVARDQEIGQPINSGKRSETADGVTRESEGGSRLSLLCPVRQDQPRGYSGACLCSVPLEQRCAGCGTNASQPCRRYPSSSIWSAAAIASLSATRIEVRSLRTSAGESPNYPTSLWHCFSRSSIALNLPRSQRSKRQADPRSGPAADACDQAAFRPRLLSAFAALTAGAAAGAGAPLTLPPLRWPSPMLLAKFDRASA